MRNDALVYGNNGLGWVAAVVFYRLNLYRVVAPKDDAFDLLVDIAEGRYRLNEISPRLVSWAMPSD